MLTSLLGIRRHQLFLNPQSTLSNAQSGLLKSYIDRRCAGEPCQYITGRTDFMGLEIEVTPDTLIPRPETEAIVEEVIKRAADRPPGAPPPAVLDLCTGSGCIAVAVAVLLPGARVVATDISKAALLVAGRNAALHMVGASIEFRSGDLFDALKSTAPGRATVNDGFDFILSNPPYIKSTDLSGLQSEVIRHEPTGALNGGSDGLDYISTIIVEAPGYLKPGGALIMEIGYDLSGPVTALLERSGRYPVFGIEKDLNEIERMVVATTAR